MRRGSGNLELIAFQPVGDGPGGIVRTGAFTNEADSDVTLTTLHTLDPGRILATTRITRGCEAPSNHLLLTTYRVEDPASTAEPQRILSIRFDNPPLPAEDDTGWAASDGNEFPLEVPMEWPQALAPDEEYEGDHLVGCSGWVIAPDDSGGDVPFDHPMGFDWEFQIALDDDSRGFQRLLSPASTKPEGEAPRAGPSTRSAHAPGSARPGVGQGPSTGQLPRPGQARRPRRRLRALDPGRWPQRPWVLAHRDPPATVARHCPRRRQRRHGPKQNTGRVPISCIPGRE